MEGVFGSAEVSEKSTDVGGVGAGGTGQAKAETQGNRNQSSIQSVRTGDPSTPISQLKSLRNLPQTSIRGTVKQTASILG